MQIKVEFEPWFERRLRAGSALVRVSDNIVRRFTIGRRPAALFEAEIKRVRNLAVADAVQISSETGHPFNIRDVDYSRLDEVKEMAA